MDNKMVMGVFKSNIVVQFQVRYMSYPGFNWNKTFTYQSERSMSSTFDKNNASHKNSVEER